MMRLEIMERKQWLLWDVDDDGRKKPYNKYGDLSGSNRRHDYLTYVVAQRYHQIRRTMGIAWCFTPDDEFFGLDIDDCGADWQIHDWASKIVDALVLTGTYIEWSPSGHGLKAWFKGTYPAGPSKAKVGDGLLELFGRRCQFFTFTGVQLVDDRNPKIVDGTEFAEWLVDRYYAKETTKVASQASAAPRRYPSGIGNPLEEAIARYVDRAEVPGPGNRNNHAFRLAGHLRKLQHHGEIASEELIWRYMLSWNSRMTFPLDEEELRSAVESSGINGTPRDVQDVRTGTVPQRDNAGVTIDIDEAEQAEQAGQEPPDILTEPFPEDLLDSPGFISQFCRYAMRTALYPQPQWTLGAAISFLGTLTGRKVQLADHTRTNFYILCLGPGGSGKDHPRKLMMRILTELGATELLGPEMLASAAGLVSHAKIAPSILFPLDEFGMLMSAIASKNSPHLSAVRMELLSLFTSSSILWKGRAYGDASKSPQIDQPNVSIFGSATPVTVWPHINSYEVESGMVPRMMLLTGTNVIDHDPEYVPLPEDLLRESRYWLEQSIDPTAEGEPMTPNPRVVPVTDEAQARLKKHRRSISERRTKEHDAKAALWGRTNEKAVKLSLLFSCSRNRGSLVELEDVNRAIRLANWTTRLLVSECIRNRVFAETPRDRNVNEIFDFIRSARKGRTRNQITRRFQRMDRRQRDDILNDLIETRKVIRKDVMVSTKDGRKYPQIVYKSGADEM